MNLYVIRHGETNMEKNKIIATEKEQLNYNAIQQAISIGKELNKLEIYNEMRKKCIIFIMN